MPSTTNGAMFKRYYNDRKVWPPGQYHDDTHILVNGVADGDADLEVVEDSDVIDIRGGVVMNDSGYVDELDKHFEKWLKTQTTEVFTVECPVEKAEAVKAAVVTAGGKLNK